MKINDVFILKKDLPSVKSGTEFIVKDLGGEKDLFLVAINQISFCVHDIEDFYKWFEKKQTRWIPEIGQVYYYITDYFGRGVATRICKDSKDWFSNCKIDIGNCFERESDVQFCIDEFIKPALNKWHEEYPEGSPRG